MTNRIAIFVAGVTLGTGGVWIGPTIVGQQRGGTKPPVVTKDLTNATLKKTLESLGYKPKPLESGGYEIESKAGELTVFVVANLSKSGQKLWLTINLGDMTASDKVDATRLYAMLQKNTAIQPAHFFINAKDNLRMGAPLDNRGLTSALIKKQIDQLTTYVNDTRDLWRHVE